MLGQAKMRNFIMFITAFVFNFLTNMFVLFDGLTILSVTTVLVHRAVLHFLTIHLDHVIQIGTSRTWRAGSQKPQLEFGMSA